MVFIDVDINVAAYGTLTDLEIVENVNSKYEIIDDDDEDNTEDVVEENVSAAEARNSLKKLKIYFERCEGKKPETFFNLISVENDLDMQANKHKKQLTMDHFLN